MDTKKLFEKCIDQATTVIKQIDPSSFEVVTPCSGWTVRRLIGHVLHEMSCVPEILQGITIDEVGNEESNIKNDTFVKHWEVAAAEALATVKQADLSSQARFSSQEIEGEQYVTELSGDLLLHAWDLSVAIDKELNFESDVAQAVYLHSLRYVKRLHRGNQPATTTSSNNQPSIQAKLLTLFRRPH